MIDIVSKIKSFCRVAVMVVVSFVAAEVPAQSTSSLSKAVQTMLAEPLFRHASVGISVRTVSDGKELYSYDAQRSLVPASLVKLYTTATCFELLGSNFRFTTKIAYDGSIDASGVLHGNVYIIGGGDPLLGSYRYSQTQPDTIFAQWMRALSKVGIKSIDGRVCYNASVFDKSPLPDTWQWGDIGNYYASGVSGLNFHENMFFIYFNPGKQQGHPASVASIKPRNLNVNLQNEVTTGPVNSGDKVVVYGDPSGRLRQCCGTVPLGKQNFPIRASMPQPAQTCAELFSVYLRANGINVGNSVSEVFSLPQQLITVLNYQSSTLYEVAQYTNLTSNNLYAESMCKYLGYMRFGVGSYSNGTRAITDFIRHKGLDLQGTELVDGSGLSRQNKTTADALTQFLVMVASQKFYPDFVATLGKVGHSGTVKSLLPNKPASVEMYAKSGSMQGVCAYAGYVITASGDRLVFSVVCNNVSASSSTVKSKLQPVLLEIARLGI